MATLAAMLRHKGLDVRGSDQDVYPPMSDFLAAEGIPALTGYRREHITADIDIVIVGNAISRGNPELEEVLRPEDPVLFIAGSRPRVTSSGTRARL